MWLLDCTLEPMVCGGGAPLIDWHDVEVLAVVVDGEEYGLLVYFDYVEVEVGAKAKGGDVVDHIARMWICSGVAFTDEVRHVVATPHGLLGV